MRSLKKKCSAKRIFYHFSSLSRSCWIPASSRNQRCYRPWKNIGWATFYHLGNPMTFNLSSRAYIFAMLPRYLVHWICGS